MRDLNEIQCFVKAVELKSLTAAAKALELPKSSVSRKIRDLESRLGLTLMTRTTRALNLTEPGRHFFEKAALALKEIDFAEELLDGEHQEVEGTLKVTAPYDFVVGSFNDLVTAFLKDHPKVRVEALMTDRVVDLIAEGFDCAFRAGELEDSTLIARKIQSVDIVLIASSQYLKERGTPKSLAELDRHECIGFAPEGTVLKWTLKGPTGKKEYHPKGRLILNSMLAVKDTVLKGGGVGLLPMNFMDAELKDRSVRIVCGDWRLVGNPMHLVFPGQKYLSPKLRAFIEYATRYMAR
jgi:DNA-binding transcriptional LysR family regulator